MLMWIKTYAGISSSASLGGFLTQTVDRVLRRLYSYPISS